MEKQSAIRETEVLADANRLSGAGLRQAALDLLLEFASDYPRSARVLAAIGRLYLLEKNYPESVRYLRQSIHIDELSRSKSLAVDGYDEDFNDEDLAYVENQESPPDDKKLDFGIEKLPSVDKSNILSDVQSREEAEPENVDTDSAARPSCRSEELANTPDVESYDKVGNGEIHQAVAEPTDSREIFLLDDDFEPTLATFDEAIEKELAEVELPSSDIHESSTDDELLGDELYIESTTDLAPDEANELSWEELDDLDSYVATTHERIESVVVGRGALTREQRAKQVAVTLVEKFELGRDFLPLLQAIFFENGWGAARVAIERELAKGTLREELMLAREVRHFWWESDRYWTTFRSVYSNGMNLQAEATYKIMSWAEALRLVACFPSLPSMEEVEDLVEEVFQLWYDSKRLRRSFPVFFKFLKYRTGSMPGTLSRWEPRCFDEYQDDGVEDSLFKANGEEEELRRQLWEFGVDIYKVRADDNKLLANREGAGE